MALKWVRCVTRFNRPNEAGRSVTHYKGDWLQLRNMELKQRLAAGQIEDPSTTFQPELFEADECGIVTSNAAIVPDDLSYNLPIVRSTEYEQAYKYTLHWNQGFLRKELLPISFELLKTWEMLVPLESFSTLANSIGSIEDRQRTYEVIGDLRIPVYNVDQMFIRRCTATTNLMKAWETERSGAGDPRLAFLRALFVNPLLILALPSSWISGSHV